MYWVVHACIHYKNLILCLNFMYYIVCHTIGGDDVGAECIRHWKYLGLPSHRYNEYFGCANPENLRSQDWCPTEVNRDGEYVIGSDKWGFCPDNCPKHNNSISPSMEEEDLDGSRSESINNSHENSETKEIDEDGSSSEHVDKSDNNFMDQEFHYQEEEIPSNTESFLKQPK